MKTIKWLSLRAACPNKTDSKFSKSTIRRFLLCGCCPREPACGGGSVAGTTDRCARRQNAYLTRPSKVGGHPVQGRQGREGMRNCGRRRAATQRRRRARAPRACGRATAAPLPLDLAGALLEPLCAVWPLMSSSAAHAYRGAYGPSHPGPPSLLPEAARRTVPLHLFAAGTGAAAAVRRGTGEAARAERPAPLRPATDPRPPSAPMPAPTAAAATRLRASLHPHDTSNVSLHPGAGCPRSRPGGRARMQATASGVGPGTAGEAPGGALPAQRHPGPARRPWGRLLPPCPRPAVAHPQAGPSSHREAALALPFRGCGSAHGEWPFPPPPAPHNHPRRQRARAPPGAGSPGSGMVLAAAIRPRRQLAGPGLLGVVRASARPFLRGSSRRPVHPGPANRVAGRLPASRGPLAVLPGPSVAAALRARLRPRRRLRSSTRANPAVPRARLRRRACAVASVDYAPGPHTRSGARACGSGLRGTGRRAARRLHGRTPARGPAVGDSCAQGTVVACRFITAQGAVAA